MKAHFSLWDEGGAIDISRHLDMSWNEKKFACHLNTERSVYRGLSDFRTGRNRIASFVLSSHFLIERETVVDCPDIPRLFALYPRLKVKGARFEMR